MVEIKGRSRDFILGINASSEYEKYAHGFDVNNLLKKETGKLGKDAFVDEQPKDHRGENECMPPSFYLRWGFERAEGNQYWHKYIRVAVNIAPQYLDELTGPDGKLEWRRLAEQIAFVQVNNVGLSPRDYLCLTITDDRGVKIIPDGQSLPVLIEEAMEHPLSVTSDVGPRRTLLERLLKRNLEFNP